MKHFVVSVMGAGFGYFGIIFLIALENVFPPIPSEVILTLGGFMTSYTKMSVFGVIIASTIGSLIGAIILYYIGLKFSKTKLKKISSKFFYSQDDISNTSSFFRKHGYMTVFYCRFVPVLRSVISIPAGANKMNIKPFILFTLIGSAIWNTVLVVLGRIFGKNYEYIVDIFKKYELYIGIFVGVIIIVIIMINIFKKKKNKLN